MLFHLALSSPSVRWSGRHQVFLVLLLGWLLLPGLVWAQGSSDELPTGWQQLPAKEFIELAEPLVSSASKKQQRELVSHAWSTFLTDGKFINKGQWSEVDAMMGLFGGARRQLLVDPNNRDATRKVLKKYVDSLRRLIDKRLKSDSSLLAEADFKGLKEVLFSLKRIVPKAQTAQLALQWMEANEWELLSLNDQVDLLEFLDAPLFSNKRFSARWTGFLRAPTSEDYVFEQFCLGEAEGSMVVKIDGKQVLDTSNGLQDETVYRSEPIAMKAGKRVAIEVNYVFNARAMTAPDSVRRMRRFPIVVLQWESESVDQETIPASVFSIADESNGNRKRRGRKFVAGLKGEYFQDLEFSKLAGSRVDPNLEMFWETASVCSEHEDKKQEIVDACFKTIFSMDVAKDTRPGSRWVNSVSNLAGHASCSQRMALVDHVLEHPSLLSKLAPGAICNLVGCTHALPTQRHLELLQKWGEHRDPVTYLPVVYPVNLRGRYRHFVENQGGIHRIGAYLIGCRWGDAEWLCENCLSKSGDDCNLCVAYVLAFASRREGQGVWLTDLLDEKLADESITGEFRARWLLARATAAEFTGSGIPRPVKALPYLKEAFLLAESDQLKFVIFSEWTNRLYSIDMSSEAKALVDEYGPRFSAEQQELLANRAELGDRLRVAYEEARKDLENQAVPAEMVEDLERRLAGAQARGDSAEASQYQSALEAIRSAATADSQSSQ